MIIILRPKMAKVLTVSELRAIQPLAQAPGITLSFDPSCGKLVKVSDENGALRSSQMRVYDRLCATRAALLLAGNGPRELVLAQSGVLSYKPRADACAAWKAMSRDKRTALRKRFADESATFRRTGAADLSDFGFDTTFVSWFDLGGNGSILCED